MKLPDRFTLTVAALALLYVASCTAILDFLSRTGNP
jgi:hypothetical protein